MKHLSGERKAILMDEVRRERDQLRKVVEYYTETAEDYRAWSRNFHMHFGFYRGHTGIFGLEAMLRQMSLEVLSRLQWQHGEPGRFLDAGCGVGSTARLAACLFPSSQIHGITIVPWQVKKARQLLWTSPLKRNMGGRVHITLDDFRYSAFPDGHFNGIYAIESVCYGKGPAKEDFLAESRRLLKNGGRLVVADGFLKKAAPSPWVRYCAGKVCKGWAMEGFARLHDFVDALKTQGYRDIRVEEISWRVAPSALYILPVSLKYVFTRLLFRKRDRLCWNHLWAAIMGLLLGMSRRGFGYYIISATKQ